MAQEYTHEPKYVCRLQVATKFMPVSSLIIGELHVMTMINC